MKKFKEFISESKIDSLKKKLDTKLGQLSMAKERRKMKNQHVQSQREMKLADEISSLRAEISKLEK